MVSTLEDVEDAEWITLTEGEEIVDKMNPHPIEYVLPVLLAVAATVTWLVVASIVDFLPWWSAAFGAGTGLAIVVMAHLRRITTMYVFTTSEIYKRYGVLDEDSTQIRIDKIQNKSVNLSWFERHLGYGDITIYTSGSGTQDMQISNIPEPRTINTEISKMMELIGENAGEEGNGGSLDDLKWVPDENGNTGYQ